MTLGEIAASLNLPVFPCNSEKFPCTKSGFKDAVTDKKDVIRLFSEPGTALIGVPTGEISGIVVIDVDVANGAKGMEWLNENANALPETRTHKTRSGGLHLVFKYPFGIEIRNSASKIAPNIDVRGNGGYVIYPPSAGYQVADQTEPADMPQWLIRACREANSKTATPKLKQTIPQRTSMSEHDASKGTAWGLKALEGECEEVSRAPFGDQEATLNEAALKVGALIAGEQLSESYGRQQLIQAGNLMSSAPGRQKWTSREIEEKVRRGIEHGKATPRRPKERIAQQYTPPSREYAHVEETPQQIAMEEIPFAPIDDIAEPTDPEEKISALINKFNQKYAIVNDNGSVVIFQNGYDDMLHRKRIDRLTTRDFNILYMNDKILCGLDGKDKPIYKTKSAIWLNHENRKQYIDGVVFDPTSTAPKDGVLNLWEGYAIKPASGNWYYMREHIRQIICENDPEHFNYLMGWMARMLQFPGQQGEVAVVMKGGEGTGKGTLAKALLKIIGQHGLAISNAKHLTSNFNAHLRDAIFLFADEAFFAGDKAHVGVLKSVITEPHLTIEAKHVNAIQMRNFLHIMMASNEEWVVPASLDARRFLVLEVSDKRRNDHKYFGEIQDQMDTGGYAAMLHDLLNYDLNEFNVRDVPRTEGLQKQQKLSLPTHMNWWKECLVRGFVLKSKFGLDNEFRKWMPKMSTELLYESYIQYAQQRHERRPMSLEAFATFFKNDLKHEKIRLDKSGIVGEHVNNETNMYGDVKRVPRLLVKNRPWGYKIGDLDSARDMFMRVTKITVEWDEDDDDHG